MTMPPRVRAGFTLMEVMTAITVTALVAALAASALHAGIDVRERVQRHRLTIDAEARATRWVANMLRHPPEASAISEPIFAINRDANGTETTTFLSRGVSEPAGTGPIWRVTIGVLADGLHIHAETVSANETRVPLETVLPHVTAINVEALDADAWRADWPVLRSMPKAVRIALSTLDGARRDPIVFPIAPLAVASQ